MSMKYLDFIACLRSVSILWHVSELSECHSTFMTNPFHKMFTTYPHHTVCLTVYLVVSLCSADTSCYHLTKTEVHNSRRRYAIFTYGKVQLSLSLTIRDGSHANERQNGRGTLFAPWRIFILFNETS
jgi:hypothetical protein